MVHDAPVPAVRGEALVRVTCAGICNTDLEITRGYGGFTGIPGHEFVGVVVQSDSPDLVGKRVVGEINAGCGRCPDCRAGDSRHCPSRSVLGIKNREGAFAEFLSLPPENLIEVPDSISDAQAVFAEPLAAALHILDQVDITGSSRVAVIGDGKLAQLVVMALARTGCGLTVVGKHHTKLDIASNSGAKVIEIPGTESAPNRFPDGMSAAERFDVVVEASGSPTGLELALGLVRPMGILVLKSTHHGLATVDTSLIVVNEISVIGSRCGRLAGAIELLSKGLVDVQPLVSGCLPMNDWAAAFSKAASPNTLKIILDMSHPAG
jgi:threonine dehydrogenase-like Zn-dependent dehydrogenase